MSTRDKLRLLLIAFAICALIVGLVLWDVYDGNLSIRTTFRRNSEVDLLRLYDDKVTTQKADAVPDALKAEVDEWLQWNLDYPDWQPRMKRGVVTKEDEGFALRLRGVTEGELILHSYVILLVRNDYVICDVTRASSSEAWQYYQRDATPRDRELYEKIKEHGLPPW